MGGAGVSHEGHPAKIFRVHSFVRVVSSPGEGGAGWGSLPLGVGRLIGGLRSGASVFLSVFALSVAASMQKPVCVSGAVVFEVRRVVGFEGCVVEVLSGGLVHRLSAPVAGGAVGEVVEESSADGLVPVPVPSFGGRSRLFRGSLLVVPFRCDGEEVCGALVLHPVHHCLLAGVDDDHLGSIVLVLVDGGLCRCGVDDQNVYFLGVLLGLAYRCVACRLGHLLHDGCVLVVRGVEASESIGKLIEVHEDVARFHVLPAPGALASCRLRWADHDLQCHRPTHLLLCRKRRPLHDRSILLIGQCLPV